MPRIEFQLLVIAVYVTILADFYYFNKVKKLSKIEIAVITFAIFATAIPTEILLWSLWPY